MSILLSHYGGADYFYHKNHLGSVTEITDSNQTVVNSYAYDAFGNILSETGSLAHNPFTYTGREYHVPSGLYYYRARFYDPQLGRFITQDPIGHLGGMNLYAYVGNAPSIFADPLGLIIGECGPLLGLQWYEIEHGIQADFISLTINVNPPNLYTATLVGYSCQITLDRYGNLYVGLLGANFGKGAMIFSLSLTEGYLSDSYGCSKPSEDELIDFSKGHSINASGGLGFGVGMTWVPGKGTATERGVMSPQIGVSYIYIWHLNLLTLPIDW
jgi:RHS repeat-associated protein